MELAQRENGSAGTSCFYAVIKAERRDLLFFAIDPFFLFKINLKL
jgi:hypothetical protein